MSKRARVLFVGVAPSSESELGVAVADFVEVLTERDVAKAVVRAQQVGARAVILDLGGDGSPLRAQAIKAMEDLRRVLPQVAIVALADNKAPDLILHAMRAGAREFVVRGDRDELARVLGELFNPSASSGARGRLISVFAAKGGTGATLLATALAGALHASDKRVLLLDLDLQLGDALVFLDIDCGFTIVDLLAQMQRLDRDLLLASLTRHESGVYVLSQSGRLEDADRARTADIPALLRFLSRHFDYVVIDGLAGFDELSMTALDASDKVLLLLSQDVPAVKNARRCSDVFRRLGYSDAKVSMVVNRYDKADQIDLAAIESGVGRPVADIVANDFRSVRQAIDKGVNLTEAAPRSKVAEDVRRLALLVSESAGHQTKKKTGFFSGLFGSKGGARDGTERAVETIR